MTQKWQIFQTRVRAASFINIFGRHCLPFFTTLYKIMDLNVFQDNYKKQHEEKFKKINVVLFVYVWGGDELSVIIGSRIYRRCVPPPFFFPQRNSPRDEVSENKSRRWVLYERTWSEFKES